MRRLLLAGVLLIGASGILSAAKVQIDDHTLCPVALRAFDEKDLPAIEEFFRFVQDIFDDLNARYTDQKEPAPGTKLTDMSVEVPIILGFCRQHLGLTIYQEVVKTYRGMRSLQTPLGSGDTGGSGAETKARGYVALPRIGLHLRHLGPECRLLRLQCMSPKLAQSVGSLRRSDPSVVGGEADMTT